jgi:hypothetical protein
MVPLAACSVSDSADADAKGVPGTGSGTARSYPVAGFSAVELRGSDDADVRVGSAFSVRAEGPAADLDKLVIEKVGDSLRIGRKSGIGLWNGGGQHAVKIFVTMPRIASAAVAGSGNLAIDSIEGSRFSGVSAGSGDLAIARLGVDAADLTISGSGGITAAGGTARKLSLSVVGSGDISAARLKAASAEVSIAGSGDVTADVAGPAEVSIVGSGDADLGRGAKCTISKVGSGEVKCGG